MSTLSIIRFSFRSNIAIIFFLLTIELCSRLEDSIRYGAPFLGEYNSKRLRTMSETDGFSRNVPNARFEKWQNNALGFRGSDISIQKTPGTKRIICLGASETYGSVFEGSGKDWPSQLNSILSNSSFQVVNASVVGMSLNSYASYMKKYVLKISPDIVICFVNPMFSAVIYERKCNTTPKTIKSNGSGNNYPLISKQKLIANIRCFTKLKQILKTAIQTSFPQLLKQYQIRDNENQLKEAESLRLMGRSPINTVSDDSVAAFKTELTNLVVFLKSHGITTMLSTYPMLMSRDNLSKYQEIFLDNRRFSVEFSEIGMIDVVDRYNSAISEVAKEQRVLFVDSNKLVPKTTEYFGDNVHYTERASHIIAEEIATQLINSSSVRTKPVSLKPMLSLEGR